MDGPQGPQGPQGPRGPRGFDGQQGPPGTGAEVASALQELILYMRSQQPSRPDEAMLPGGNQPPPPPPPGAARVRAGKRATQGDPDAMEESMGQPPNPPGPPGGGAGGAQIHLYPELLRTNRLILEEFHSISQSNRQMHEAALEFEDRRVGEAKARSIEAQEHHERYAHMFRHALNPLAAHIEAQSQSMATGVAAIQQASAHMAAASSHQAAQANTIAAQFAVAMNQHAEAAARRPDERNLAGPEEPPNTGILGLALEPAEDMRDSVKRPKEVAAETERQISQEPQKQIRRLASAARKGAQAESRAASAAPANSRERAFAPGFKPPVHISELDQQPLAVAAGKARSSREAVEATKPRRGRSEHKEIDYDVLNKISNDVLDLQEAERATERSRSKAKSIPRSLSTRTLPYDESGRPLPIIEKVRTRSRGTPRLTPGRRSIT